MKKFITGLIIGLLIATAGVGLAAGETVQATFAKFNFIVNGEVKTLEADPLVYQGATYLPVRVVSNMLGYNVIYRAESRTIEFTNNIGRENAMETVTNINLDEWISLRDFALQYPSAYTEYIQPVQNQMRNAGDGYKYEINTNKGTIKMIYFQYQNYLNINDLKTKNII